MSLQTRLASLISAIGADVKSLQTQINAIDPIELLPLTRPGELVVVAGSTPIYLSGAYTLVDYRVSVGVAPVGSSLIVDINKNATSLFTTQANRPTIAAGSKLASTTMPNIVTFAANDYITVDVDQIGSTTAGSDLAILLRLRRTA